MTALYRAGQSVQACPPPSGLLTILCCSTPPAISHALITMAEPYTIATGVGFLIVTVILGYLGLSKSNEVSGDVREWQQTDSKSLIGLNFFGSSSMVPTLIFGIMALIVLVACCYCLSGCWCFHPRQVNIHGWAEKRRLLREKSTAPAKSESLPVLIENPEVPLDNSPPPPPFSWSQPRSQRKILPLYCLFQNKTDLKFI